MRNVTGNRRAFLAACVLAAVAQAAIAAPGDPTAAQRRMLAARAAQADGLNTLADMVLGARVSAVRTLGEALGPGSPGEIALRVFLRGARTVGEPRVYSDGVAQVDVVVPLEVVIREVRRIFKPGEHETADLPDLRHVAVDGLLSATGTGRAPRDAAPEMVARAERAPPDALPELYPVGWEHVSGGGRVAAQREARIRAYEAMAARLRTVYVDQARTVADLVDGSAPAKAVLDAFVRGLPVTGPARLMPDRIAEVEVAAPVPALIAALKEICKVLGLETDLSDEKLDRISVRLKASSLDALGRGMPPPAQAAPAAGPRVAGGAALPDWAAGSLEARASAPVNPDVENRQEALILAARSAKARAMASLQEQAEALDLGGGVTVRQRAAADEAFRRDLRTFLSSTRTVSYRMAEGGKEWIVELELPLLRLYEFSRREE